jgi:type II secretory pathway pseudopilin PulG
MLTVIGILGILMAAAASGIARGRARARVVKANAEVRELVNAILAYEAAEDTLFQVSDETRGDEATAQNLQELLGNTRKPVYLNAPMSGSPPAFRDPWGNPYRFRIVGRTEAARDANKEHVSATVTFPNRQRGLRW